MSVKVSHEGCLSSKRGLSSANVPLLLLMLAMAGKEASGAGLSLTLGFSPGLSQPQDCPRFLDSLEVLPFYKPIHLKKNKLFSAPHSILFWTEFIWRKTRVIDGGAVCKSDKNCANFRHEEGKMGKVCEYLQQRQQICENNAKPMRIASEFHSWLYGERNPVARFDYNCLRTRPENALLALRRNSF